MPVLLYAADIAGYHIADKGWEGGLGYTFSSKATHAGGQE